MTAWLWLPAVLLLAAAAGVLVAVAIGQAVHAADHRAGLTEPGCCDQPRHRLHRRYPSWLPDLCRRRPR